MLIHTTMLSPNLFVPLTFSKYHDSYLTAQYSPLVQKYAFIMWSRQKPQCDTCQQYLDLKDVEHRLHHSLEEFLCYHCLEKVLADNNTLQPTAEGFWTFKKK